MMVASCSLALAFLSCSLSEGELNGTNFFQKYEGSNGVRVQVAGVCSVYDDKVTAWNSAGVNEPDLAVSVSKQLLFYGGADLSYIPGHKNRLVVLKVYCPPGARVSIRSLDSSLNASYDCIGPEYNDYYAVLMIAVSQSAKEASVDITVPDGPISSCIFASKSNQSGRLGDSKVELKSITRLTSEELTVNYESNMVNNCLFGQNNKGWALRFVAPTPQTGYEYSFQVIPKGGTKLAAVDINGKPDTRPITAPFDVICDPATGLPANPKQYVAYPYALGINTQKANPILATNIDPKYLRSVGLYEYKSATIRISGIPLDPRQ